MKFKKVDHIGIAVPNLEEAVKVYSTLLNKQPEHYEEVAEQKAKTAFFGVGETNLELLQSTSPDGPIGKYIEKNGGRGGLHHATCSGARRSTSRSVSATRPKSTSPSTAHTMFVAQSAVGWSE